MFLDYVSGIGSYYNNSGAVWQNVCNALSAKGVSFQDILANKAKAFSGGDLVITEPTDYSEYPYDKSLDTKAKEDMTLDEYKQWFVHQLSQMPKSGYYVSTFTGSTVIKEEAFERMKSDPEYEQKILQMLRQGFSVTGIWAGRAIGYRVIGDSEESTYGYAYPAKDNQQSAKKKKTENNEESWWDQRVRKISERNREYAARSQARQIEHGRLEREYYQQRQAAAAKKQHVFLMQSLNGMQNTSQDWLAGLMMPASATIPNESMLNAYIAFLSRTRTD